MPPTTLECAAYYNSERFTHDAVLWMIRANHLPDAVLVAARVAYRDSPEFQYAAAGHAAKAVAA